MNAGPRVYQSPASILLTCGRILGVTRVPTVLLPKIAGGWLTTGGKHTHFTVAF
jgi:hypothetical protein